LISPDQGRGNGVEILNYRTVFGAKRVEILI
jgi:hypothetical protein